MYKCLLLVVALVVSTAAIAAPPAMLDLGEPVGEELQEFRTAADVSCDSQGAVAEDPLAVDLGFTFASSCFVCTASSQCQSYCGGGTPGFDFACIYEPEYGHRCCVCI